MKNRYKVQGARKKKMVCGARYRVHGKTEIKGFPCTVDLVPWTCLLKN